MNIQNMVSSLLFDEGIINYIKRKKDIYTLKNHRILFPINYNNRVTKIYLQKKFGYVDIYIYSKMASMKKTSSMK